MILEEVEGLYRIITLKEIRRTKKVRFDTLDLSLIPHAVSINYVDGYQLFYQKPFGNRTDPFFVNESGSPKRALALL